MNIEQAQKEAEFNEIKKLVNDAIGAIDRADPKWERRAINWAHLRCVDVELLIGPDCWRYVATVEEVAPTDNQPLIDHVLAYLEERGRDDVEIVLEW